MSIKRLAVGAVCAAAVLQLNACGPNNEHVKQVLRLGSSITSQHNEFQSNVPFASLTLGPSAPAPFAEIAARRGPLECAVLPMPDSIGAVLITRTTAAPGEHLYDAIVRLSDGSVTRYPLRRSRDRSNNLLLRGSFPLTTEYVSSCPLELRVTSDGPTIEFRWLAEPQPDGRAGGLPVEEPQLLKRGQSLPEFFMQTLGGQEVSSQQFKGRLLVINYWATWCGPCISEIPTLTALKSRFERTGVSFVALAADEQSKVSVFLDQNEFPFEHYLVANDALPVFGNSLPRTIVVAANGTVVYDKLGTPDIKKEVGAVLATQIGAQ